MDVGNSHRLAEKQGLRPETRAPGAPSLGGELT